ncbi:MAG TPA: (2Fe-2S)-binding protein [Candidatus Binatia bacterium]|nr:(2Fe-2S)-binding protein [Candidatus Binatia bacterium]
MDQTIRLRVDGKAQSVQADPEMPLLYALRDDLGMENPRFGCGLSQCGACTVLVDGKATRSCVTPVAKVEGHAVTTLAGLGTPEHPHPLQKAFMEEAAMQCGYCLNGWIMTAADLLHREKSPSREQIVKALNGVVCRCGAHVAMLRAVERAAKEMSA